MAELNIKTNDALYTDGVGAPSKGIAVMGTDGVNPQLILTDATGKLQVDVVGGGAAGKQYDDGDARGIATGTLMMVDDGANIQSASGDNTGKLNINVSNTPTVTANAGTNLNTSALALEAGGNLATIAGDTTSIDGKITACNTGAIAGTVTANAGTNLNTSALALEAGGNLATIAGDTTSIDGKITACNTGAVVVASSQGNVAHDAIDSGNPLKIGLKTIAHGTNPTAVAAADRTDWYANRAGIPFVISGHPNIITLRANYDAAQTDTAIVTVGGGAKILVTRISVMCSNANTVNVSVLIGFGAANTPTTTGVILAHPNIAAGSGIVEGSGAGILGIGADGEDLRITSSVPTTGSIDVIVSYYTIES